jgi:hypothetical protein
MGGGGIRIGKSARPFSLSPFLRPAPKLPRSQSSLACVTVVVDWNTGQVFSYEKALNIKQIIKIEGLGLGFSLL